MTIHYAARIDFRTFIDPRDNTVTYIALCGARGDNPKMFINGRNPHADAKNKRGAWRISCEDCQKKVGE